MKIVSVRDPRWADENCTTISLLVKFDTLDREAEFFAMPNDVEAHGRELLVRAMNGEFGPIKEYEPPQVDVESERRYNIEQIAKLCDASRSIVPDAILRSPCFDIEDQWLRRLQAIEVWRLHAMTAATHAPDVAAIRAAYTDLVERLK